VHQSPRKRSSLRCSLFVLSLLFSLNAAAQIYVRPAGPTTRTPVTLTVMTFCPPEVAPVVSVSGNVIKVHVTVRACWEPPFYEAFEAKVPGLLAPGEYQVEITGGGTIPERNTSFIVRDAEPRPLTVTPFAVPSTQLAPIYARINEPLCSPGNTCQVFVDNVQATNVRVDDQGRLWFTPPHLPPGLKSVTVDNANNRREVPNAMYYFAHGGEPNRSIFERILFPLLTELPGANGSRWITEATISNPRRAYVENYNQIHPFVCIDYPCGERLSPGELVQFDGGEYPRGVVLLSPWSESPYLSFALRGRDISRAAEGFGTEIPVVRESELFTGTDMALLDVPLQSGYRAKLRVYAFDVNSGLLPGATAKIVRVNGGATTTLGVELTRTCIDDATCAVTPYYGEIDLPSNIGRADVFVEVAEPAQFWSFITVTNNETQQVTLVTANGQGKARCPRETCGGDE
jgi:hypothetical protein